MVLLSTLAGWYQVSTYTNSEMLLSLFFPVLEALLHGYHTGRQNERFWKDATVTFSSGWKEVYCLSHPETLLSQQSIDRLETTLARLLLRSHPTCKECVLRTHLDERKYLEDIMKARRFLLPFVHGVDKFAIEQAILLTKSHHATLVPLVLFHLPEERRKKGVRLEYLQQSMDFLEIVKQKADRHAVQTEKLEVFTGDVVQSINLVASEMECEGMLLFVSQKGGILLQIEHIKGVMKMPVCKLYITHLPTVETKRYITAFCWHFLHWLAGMNEKRVDQIAGQEYLARETEFAAKV